jgi:gliding motility-associated lipoprotein GldB
MKNFLIITTISLLVFACNKKSQTEKAVEEIPIEIKVTRFDKLFFETNPENLAQLKSQFSFLFPAETPDSIWTNKMQNPMWRELYTEVQKKYNNTGTIQTEVENLVKHIKFYYPETKSPKIITLISEMDYNSKAIYADSLVLVPLELYLGKNHKFYQNEFPDYIKQNFEQNQIAPDLATSFGLQKIQFPKDKTLLAQMIYQGKQLYLKDKLIPESSDEAKIGYSKEQLIFCQENESYMWSNFIENQYLFSSDSKLPNRFVNAAPFSKFYLEIDNQTPGRVGAWLGWQIVRSYAENNEVKLQDLLKLDAKELFEKSKYKPRK